MRLKEIMLQMVITREGRKHNEDFQSARTDLILASALQHLGEGYREIDSGVYQSQDGKRQFRMTDKDLTATKPHVHFETTQGPNGGKRGKSYHVGIID